MIGKAKRMKYIVKSKSLNVIVQEMSCFEALNGSIKKLDFWHLHGKTVQKGNR